MRAYLQQDNVPMNPIIKNQLNMCVRRLFGVYRTVEVLRIEYNFEQSWMLLPFDSV